MPREWVEPYRPPVAVGGLAYISNAKTVRWSMPTEELPDCQGVYFVTNSGFPVYAGEAKWGVRGRYRQKAAGIHELGLVADLVGQQTRQEVWAGNVIGLNTNLKAAIGMVESWLIRYLLVRDFTHNPQARKVVNIAKTAVAKAPTTGMQLTFEGPPAIRGILLDQELKDQNNEPVFLSEAPDRFTYRYKPNAPF